MEFFKTICIGIHRIQNIKHIPDFFQLLFCNITVEQSTSILKVQQQKTINKKRKTCSIWEYFCLSLGFQINYSSMCEFETTACQLVLRLTLAYNKKKHQRSFTSSIWYSIRSTLFGQIMKQFWRWRLSFSTLEEWRFDLTFN